MVPSTGPFVGTASFSSLGLAPFLLKVVAELVLFIRETVRVPSESAMR